jgi:hypothetical protein
VREKLIKIIYRDTRYKIFIGLRRAFQMKYISMSKTRSQSKTYLALEYDLYSRRLRLRTKIVTVATLGERNQQLFCERIFVMIARTERILNIDI